MRSFCWRLSPFQHARQCRERSTAIPVVLGLREQMCLTGVSRWEAGSCQAAWASSGKANSGLVPAMPTMMFSFLGLPQDVLQKNTYSNGEFSRFEGFVCFKIAAYAHYMSQNPHLYDSRRNFLKCKCIQILRNTDVRFAVLISERKYSSLGTVITMLFFNI